MDEFDYWRLCDELSVSQAAQLIIGVRPGEVEAMESVGKELLPRSLAAYKTNIEAAESAVGNALLGRRLAGQIRYQVDHNWDNISECMVEQETDRPDWERSTVLVEDLKQWLWSRGLRTGFFFPDETHNPDYLNPNHPRYAPKLAAAVRAWLAVSDPQGKSPKQALTKWLRENAAEFGLSDEDGNPNQTGIEEAAKVANWQPGGGAPKTPGA